MKSGYQCAELPDPNAIFWCTVERIRRLHIKGLVELIEVADDLIASEFTRGVWVGCDSSLHLFRTDLAAPDLGPAVEEALISSEAIDYRRFFSTE
jgi:hypothetical protein